ncbi:MAG: sulfurtransferase TusA family protein [Pseudomonadota bacterium]|nr:sulfurtransferase TusA family protein [Pseudomonadota bacterium]MEE3101766.1 sulfurtransferase TusA family protein [Pseudomonadota bacterium]
MHDAEPTDPAAADRVAEEIDARGLLCPLPVLKARKRLAGLAPGARLAIVSDDPAAVIDMPHFCAEQGHALEAQDPDPRGGRRFVIRKGG